jgi:hypothetical protein
MRVSNESDRRGAAPWSLWLVSAVCFGPLALLWFLGVVMLPIWVAIVGVQLAEPERFAHDSATIWDSVSPIAYVCAGFIGLVGLVRVLTLPGRERPKSHRYFTIGMVAVGLTAVLIFEFPWFTGDLADFFEPANLAAFLVYFALPVTGTVWVLAKSWRFLLAAPVPAHVAMPRSRTTHERRDDWRLDA